MKSKPLIGHGKKTGIYSELKNGVYHLIIFDAKNPKDKKTFKLHSKNTTTPKRMRNSITEIHYALSEQ